ncbi:hypothetical protein [Kocuria dechangensis]|nr:hypothetical protein [Kocuria dechangensis]
MHTVQKGLLSREASPAGAAGRSTVLRTITGRRHRLVGQVHFTRLV